MKIFSSFVTIMILTSRLTFAGGLEVKFLGAIKEGIKLPTGVVANSEGKIFIADKKDNKILVYDLDGKLIKSAGEKGNKPGQISSPVDLAVYKDKLYVLEQGNSRISCFDFDLNFIESSGSKGNGGGQFSSPTGIAIDPYGNIYVADTSNARIQILSPQGIFYSSIGDKTLFKNPVDVAVDSLRNIYVLDKATNKVSKFSAEGNLIFVFGGLGKEPAQFQVLNLFKNPTSIAVDKKGYIYVADAGNFRIQVFDKEGAFFAQLGIRGKGRAQFEGLCGLSIDEQNRLFAVDEKNKEVQLFAQEEKPGLDLPSFPPFIRAEFKKILPEIKVIDLATDLESNLYLIDAQNKIRVLDKDFKEKFQIGQKGMSPKGIVVSPSKKIYVIDGGKGQVLIFDAEGKLSNSFGRKGSERGQFNGPRAIAMDKNENLYIADTNNFRVQIYSQDGIFKDTFGKRGINVEDFQMISDIALDSQGNIYILDEKASCVKKFTRKGNFIAAFGKEKFLKPKDLFIDAQDVLYILDAGNQKVWLFNTSGEELATFGSGGKEKINLVNPETLILDKENNVYIGNSAGRLQQFYLHHLSCFEKGNYYLVKGKFDLAQIEYKKEIATNPENVESFIKLGELYLNGDKLKDAALVLEEAIKKAPEDTQGLILLGRTYFKSGRLKEAKWAYRQAIKLAPKVTQTYYELALAYEKEKDYSLAIIALKQALKEHDAPKFQAKIDELISTWEKATKNRPSLEIEEVEIDRIFSAIYKYYNENPIGKIKIRNNTNDVLKQIKISLFIKEFMDFAWEIKMDEMEPFSMVEVPLFATFNDKILSMTEDTPFLTQLTLMYYEDVEKQTSITKPSTLYSKNALLWNNQEMVAAFITPQSAVIREFTKKVIGEFRGDARLEMVNEKLATAMLLFDTLSAYKMVYSPDPSTPFSQTSLKPDVVDYLQFPFETLKYKSGDCDDLTILFASCLETEGVDTILVTSPGHIFLMFYTGVGVEQIQMLPFAKEMLVVLEDKIWIPIEVTRVSYSFLSAWYQGAREYKKWEKEGKIGTINTHKAWGKYQTGTWRDVDFHPEIPAKDKISQIVYKDLETLTRKIVESTTQDYKKLLELDPKDITAMNQLGIVYAKFGLYDEAIKIFEEIIKIKAENPEAYGNLGNIYYLQDKFDAALTQYKLALELDPNNAKTHINLSLVYFKKKMFDEARKEFNKAEELDTSIPAQYGEYKNLLF
ncbi:MAG: tetratricopeptide repeat protein [bacterium]|nr:tetratricopeptide repeat protein [bacterium]